MATRVGFIGLGTVGIPMAANTAAAGFDLMVFDGRPEPERELAARGARVAGSPREVGAHAEIVQLWPDDDEAVLSAVLGPEGVLAGAQAGTILAIHTAVQRSTVFRVAEAAEAGGVGVLDAQATTGADGARARTLTYLIGGDAALLERCRPLFEASGPHIHHMGPLGMGVVAKCAQQAMTCGTILAVADGMRLAAAGGLDLQQFHEAMRTSSAYGRVLEDWPRSFAAMTRRRGAVYHKALRPALALAHEVDVPLTVAPLAQQWIPQVPWAAPGEAKE